MSLEGGGVDEEDDDDDDVDDSDVVLASQSTVGEDGIVTEEANRIIPVDPVNADNAATPRR